MELELAKGVKDLPPEEKILQLKIVDTLRKVFELYGYSPLETPVLERFDVLASKYSGGAEILKETFRLQDQGGRELALRYDLTVPFSRFIAMNPTLKMPFKRYQIGSVWRGERQQAGRYREFMQADFDIVGSSSIAADAEIVAVYYTALRNIGLKNFVINYNNRLLLDDLPEFADFPKEKLWNALRIIDKTDKLGTEGVQKELEKEFGSEVEKKITAFVFDGFGRKSALDTQSGRIYDQICKTLDIFGCDYKKYLNFNLWLVRGLSYYTGSVFEVILSDAPELGSIGGGGRYDELVAEFTGQPIPAVGASIGIDRLFAAQEKLGLIKKQATTTKVLVFNLSENCSSDYAQIVKQLRDANINTSFYLGDDTSFQAQLSYAVKKEIPYVLIFGEEEKKKGVVAVKNLTTREQKEIRKEELIAFFMK